MAPILRSARIDETVEELVCSIVNELAPREIRVQLETGGEPSGNLKRARIVVGIGDWQVRRQETGESVLGKRADHLGQELVQRGHSVEYRLGRHLGGLEVSRQKCARRRHNAGVEPSLGTQVRAFGVEVASGEGPTGSNLTFELECAGLQVRTFDIGDIGSDGGPGMCRRIERRQQIRNASFFYKVAGRNRYGAIWNTVREENLLHRGGKQPAPNERSEDGGIGNSIASPKRGFPIPEDIPSEPCTWRPVLLFHCWLSKTDGAGNIRNRFIRLRPKGMQQRIEFLPDPEIEGQPRRQLQLILSIEIQCVVVEIEMNRSDPTLPVNRGHRIRHELF